MSQMTHSTNQVAGGPVWAGDFLDREHLVPGGAKVDATQFNATDAVIVTVGAAGARKLKLRSIVDVASTA